MSKTYRLRPTVPNPAGGEYPEPTETLIDQNADASIAVMKSALDRLVPLQLNSSRGNTKAAAGALAALFLSSLCEFMSKNRAEDQKDTIAIYDEAVRLMAEHADKLQGIALLKALGVPADVIARGNVHVLKI